jgi:DNA phosphorothioation-associated putative methyltransferase
LSGELTLRVSVQRHKTAIRRSDISRPIRLALEDGLLNRTTTFFDYGCGHGGDISRLSELGIEASGWDPIHCAETKRRPAEVVNLGYVVNVIEDPAERAAVLKDAWSLTQKLLIVSARLSIEAKNGVSSRPYADGYVTCRGTFQKFYDQRELGEWINEILGLQSAAVAPGVFYVFQDNDLLQSFAASRYRRIAVLPRQKYSHLLFEQNHDLFDPLIGFIAKRGRIPDDSEIDVASAIRGKFGSLKRATAIIRQVTGNEQWDRIREERSQDLLVYLALSRFGGRPRLSELPCDLQLDVRAFFGTYRQASELADKLLFSAGAADVIREACKTSPIGKHLPDALYVHSTALSSLAPVLRVYEGCARAYIGVVEGANVIKLNIGKPQIAYLHYPDFDSNGHPTLAGSLVVPLNTFHIQYRDYSESKNPFILHRKETLVSPDHPLRAKFERLTKKEEHYGLYEYPELIGTKAGWEEILKTKGLIESGHRLARRPLLQG